MRSEKEIREEIKRLDELYPNVDNPDLDSQFEILEWVLEGEPRYSVADLEKIQERLEDDDRYDTWFEAKDYFKERDNVETGFHELCGVVSFIDFLRDRKRVKAILK